MKTSMYDIGDYPGFGARMAALEAQGYDTLVTDERTYDPFLRAAVIAEHTSRVEIMTGIAVAFGRTPLTLAQAAHDLNVMSKGRFLLGLGSQVKAHITRRYSMPWSHPARRMREMIQAIHAIWDSWYDGKPLKFQGEFYTHTLMSPYFAPENKAYGRAPIHLAAVGPMMTAVAAEVADGVICHPFTTPRYIREVTLPAIEAGLAARGLPRAKFEVTGSPFVATGATDKDLEAAKAEIRYQIAFYGSTPTYRAVLDLEGMGALHEALYPLSREGRWAEMTALIDDKVLQTFAIVGDAATVVTQMRARYGGLLDRASVPLAAEGAKISDLLEKVR